MPATGGDGSTGRILKTFDASGFVMTEKVFPARGRLTEHAHENAHFCFVVHGRYTESHARQEIVCEPSTLTFCPPGQPHHNDFHDQPVQVVTLEIPPRWIERVEQESIALPTALSFRDGQVTRLAQRLANEFHQMDSGAGLILEGLSLELLVTAARHLSRSSQKSTPRWLRDARELIHERFSERLTLEDIASRVGVHPVHLATVFRRHYQCTIGEYVRERRVDYACRELVRSRTPLAVIALDAGFANQGHFSSAFKRVTGFTPATYRKSFGSA